MDAQRQPGFRPTDRQVQWLLQAFLLGSLVYFLYMGNIKNYNGFVWDYDTRCWYTAGTCWWGGDSPYDREQYTEVWTRLFGEPPRNRATFVYPPAMALLALPLALFPWSVAPWIFRAVSLAAVFGIVYFIRRLSAPASDDGLLARPQGWYLGLCAYLASVTQCLSQGQCATIVVCGCLAAWHGWRQKNVALFVIGFVFASIKPQISLLPLLFILASGGVRWFLGGASAVGAVSLIVLILFPHTGLFTGYEGSLENHMTYQEFNRWSRYCGVAALAGATPFGKAAALAGIVLGVAGVAWIGVSARHRPDTVQNRIRDAQLVWILAFAAMPIHIYDLVGQMFVMATLWLVNDWRVRVAGVVLMIAADRVPTASIILGRWGGPLASYDALLLHYGTPICAALLLGIFLWHWRRASSRAANPVP